MADISTELQQILDAVYGEQVRGSIYRAIKLINDVSEVVISAGTDITSPTSSSTGYFEDSLYINTDTCDLWKCTGTNTWSLVGNIKGNGITSIEKTGTSGLVDTYTITFSDRSTQTYTVTNGADGNKWYHGTTISGGAVLPTVYPTSGIAKANAGDAYLNSSEGYVYVCITGGDANTATWSFNLALSGGGGAAALNDLNDVNIDPTTLSNKDILEYDALAGKFVNVSDRSFVRYAGSITFNDLMTGALSTYLTSAYEDMFFLVTDGGTLDSTTAAYWTGTYAAGDVIPADSHIAVINIAPAGSTPSYRFDDFGGFVDISGKLDKDLFNAVNRRTPQNITSRIQADSGASLLNAIADQDLAKYGYSIGDYFESPTNRSLVTQTYSSGSVTTQTVNVKFKYYLADMDAWYGGYDSYEVVGTHHVELFVDCMINRQWHSASDITNVGYDLSALYTYLKGSILDAIKADMKALFGGSTGLEHLLSHQLYLTKSFTACEWVSTYIHTPSEFEVYGGNAFSGNDAQKYAFNKKLALFDKFRFNQILGSGNSMWLYNMYSASAACIAHYNGFATSTGPVDARRAAGLILLH